MLQVCLNLSPIGSAQLQLCAVVQDHRIFAIEKGLEDFDPVDVDDRRSVNTNKLLRVEFFLKFGKCAANNMFFFTGVYCDVVALGLNPLDLLCLDERDAGEDLGGVDHASFQVRKAVSDSTVILQRDTGAGTLSVDVVNKKLTATLTQGEADALVPGVYVGEAAIRFSSGLNWFFSDTFTVRILKTFAPKV